MQALLQRHPAKQHCLNACNGQPDILRKHASSAPLAVSPRTADVSGSTSNSLKVAIGMTCAAAIPPAVAHTSTCQVNDGKLEEVQDNELDNMFECCPYLKDGMPCRHPVQLL